MNHPLLSVCISVDYPAKARALDAVSFEIAPGEILGLAGESGAGKSTLTLAILRLERLKGGNAYGELHFAGRDLFNLSEREMRHLRGREISLVMQSPVSALNPALRLETQLREAWTVHSAVNWRTARSETAALLVQLGLPGDDAFLRRYPGELSVGQAQRVVVAMAVMHRPRLILADEPTSALDAASRGECLKLLQQVNREFGSAILFISHDTRALDDLCARRVTLRDGKVTTPTN